MGRYGGSYEARPNAGPAKLEAAVDMFAEELKTAESVVVLEAEVEKRYRQRCRFSMRGTGLELSYSIFDGASVAIESFELASERINGLMPSVLRELRSREALGGNDLRAVHFHAPRRAESAVVVTLVYGATIADSDVWMAEAADLRRCLEEPVHCVGRCKGATLVCDEASVIEELVVGLRRFELEFPEGSFSHPYTRANERSVAWLCDRLRPLQPTILELYCGCGNHTVALASCCHRLVAVEVDQRLVAAARRNLQRNGARNATVVAQDAAKFTSRLKRNRGAFGDIPRFDAVLVDPPRRGLDANTRRILRAYDHVLYVSCNPQALKSDLDVLSESHQVQAFAALDAFPATPHLECLVHLVRRRPPGASSTMLHCDDAR